MPKNDVNLLNLTFISVLFIFFSCNEMRTPKDLQKESIIPIPVSLTASGSHFS